MDVLLPQFYGLCKMALLGALGTQPGEMPRLDLLQSFLLPHRKQEVSLGRTYCGWSRDLQALCSLYLALAGDLR